MAKKSKPQSRIIIKSYSNPLLRLHFSSVAGQAWLLRPDSRSRTEYLIPMSNIIVLDSYFNLTSKSNIIDML